MIIHNVYSELCEVHAQYKALIVHAQYKALIVHAQYKALIVHHAKVVAASMWHCFVELYAPRYSNACRMMALG